ncbi:MULTISPECIES: xylulokinase [Rhodomicrobium]|uniref:xylulokinase n=1 Tax=Rhodomicrobium TaxID=1068 RepID=UPI000B4AD5FA|nr:MULTISPECIES: xylulokinase [Rhodomicrobium]
MTSYLGIDIGTSSIKAVLIDESQRILAEASQPIAVLRPHPLWSEQDPESWWQATLAAVEAIRKAAADGWGQLQAIGLSGQQHGATLLGQGGEVLRPCILWNDGRSQAECVELTARVPDFHQRASNLAMPGFTAPKLLWVAKHEPEIFARTAMILLPKDYVRYRLSGAYVSDMSDSAGTLWMDIAARRWDNTLLAACGLTEAQMPRLVEGSDISAMLSPELATAWGLDSRQIPIAGGGGDNASSAVGIGATRDGDGFLSLGTSGVVFSATDKPVALPRRALHGFCHALPGRWHGMAVVLSAGLSLNWAAALTGHSDDIAGFIARADLFAADPARVAHAPVFLPYLTGERTPHNDPLATAHFAGLTVEHGADALGYAVLEGVAFALADCLDVLVEAGAGPKSCMLVGGGSRSAFWGQLISNVTGLTLDLPLGAEVGSAFGAARLAMLAAGGSEADVCFKPEVRRRFAPAASGAPLLAERRRRMQALYVPAPARPDGA